MVAAALWAAYNSRLALYPIQTKSFTSFFSAAAGDLIAQRFSRDKGAPVRFDWARTLRLALFNGVIMGPLGHVYYGVLDSSIFPNAPTSPLSIATKLVVDQLLWSPLCTVFFYAYKCCMEFRAGEIAQELSSKLAPTVVASWKLWVPAHVVNFSLVPTEQRVLYANVVSIAGTYVLSTCASSPTGPRRVMEPDMALPERDVAALSSHHVSQTAAGKQAAAAARASAASAQAAATARANAASVHSTTARANAASRQLQGNGVGLAALKGAGAGAALGSTSISQLRPGSPGGGGIHRRSSSPVHSGRVPAAQTLPRASPPSTLRRGHVAERADARDTITAVSKPVAAAPAPRDQATQGVLERSFGSAAAKADRILAGAHAAVQDVVRTPTKLK